MWSNILYMYKAEDDDGGSRVLSPFQHYLRHIETMEGWW